METAWRRSAAEADEQGALGIVVKGHRQMQVLGVMKHHAIPVVEVQGALPEAVEAQRAQAVVLRDDDAMIQRIFFIEDLHGSGGWKPGTEEHYHTPSDGPFAQSPRGGTTDHKQQDCKRHKCDP